MPDLGHVPTDVDILYVTRIQKERFPDAVEYDRNRNAYQLNTESASYTHLTSPPKRRE